MPEFKECQEPSALFESWHSWQLQDLLDHRLIDIPSLHLRVAAGGSDHLETLTKVDLQRAGTTGAHETEALFVAFRDRGRERRREEARGDALPPPRQIDIRTERAHVIEGARVGGDWLHVLESDDRFAGPVDRDMKDAARGKLLDEGALGLDVEWLVEHRVDSGGDDRVQDADEPRRIVRRGLANLNLDRCTHRISLTKGRSNSSLPIHAAPPRVG